MPEFIKVEKKGRVGLLTLERPKQMNALNPQLMQELGQALQSLDADEGIGAMVITGSEKAFAAGADIGVMKDYGYMDAYLSDYITRDWEHIRRIRKPVIAAVAGYALGGGCELAMMCDIVIAADNAKFGQPEVNLGIMPGSGGTQRLPRILPVAEAVKMITTGNPILAEKAKEFGLVDEIAQGDLLESALVFTKKILDKPLRRIRDMKPRLAGDPKLFFAKTREEVARASRGYPAPLEIVTCIEAAVNLPFDAGRKVEREAARIPDVPADTPVRDIRKAAVIGAGTMGGGIAMNFAKIGRAHV